MAINISKRRSLKGKVIDLDECYLRSLKGNVIDLDECYLCLSDVFYFGST